jgi:D-alanyl-D-alanine carboxypeptidase/D-alanyl-D-alanine-endopeptidase (penicillin-binding protein 4)
MRETIRLGIGSLLLLASAYALAELPSRLQRVVTNHRIPEHTLGIVVQEIGAARPLLSVNADVPRNPASAIKILTTLAALEELGPAWVWPTEVYLDGELKDGKLDGDVVSRAMATRTSSPRSSGSWCRRCGAAAWRTSPATW